MGSARRGERSSWFRLGLGGGAAGELMGGGPGSYGSRYAAAPDWAGAGGGAGAARARPDDDIVPCELSIGYAARGRGAGDDVACALLRAPGILR